MTTIVQVRTENWLPWIYINSHAFIGTTFISAVCVKEEASTADPVMWGQLCIYHVRHIVACQLAFNNSFLVICNKTDYMVAHCTCYPQPREPVSVHCHFVRHLYSQHISGIGSFTVDFINMKMGACVFFSGSISYATQGNAFREWACCVRSTVRCSQAISQREACETGPLSLCAVILSVSR